MDHFHGYRCHWATLVWKLLRNVGTGQGPVLVPAKP